jgi:pimeloyl-ACP methyl ester carboxylesterase
MLRRVLLPLCAVVFCPAGLRAEDAFFDSNGVKIHYSDEGQGEPVVLVHGFTVNLDRNWRAPGVIRALLAKGFRVIALDNRGHGKSDKPHDLDKYGMEMVEDVVRLLDHLKLKKAHVVGYSMGAIITAKLLTTHPDRLLSATLGGSGGLKEGDDLTLMDRIADGLDEGKGLAPLLVVLTPKGRPRPTAEQARQISTAILAGNDIKALSVAVRAGKQLAVPVAKLEANKVPTLALIGEVDPLKKGVDDLEGKLANLKVVVIKEADHITAFAQPEFSKALTDFLTEHSATQKGKEREPAEK